MDLQMGAGMDGVTATGRIKAGEAGEPAPPVLILTTYDSDADILAAVEAGASGYMLKDAPPEQIRQAVLSAAAGGTALAPEVAARLMGRIRNPEPALSAREIQLLGIAGHRDGKPGDREAAVHFRGHGQDAPGAHLRQARRGQPHRRDRRRRAAQDHPAALGVPVPGMRM